MRDAHSLVRLSAQIQGCPRDRIPSQPGYRRGATDLPWIQDTKGVAGMKVSLSGIVSMVGLVVAVVAVVAGLGALVLSEGLDVISDNTATNLFVVSILGSLIAIPIGVIGWRWQERRHENSVLGQAAALFAVSTFGGWVALFIYAIGKGAQDPP